jgi:hypothetical protein
MSRIKAIMSRADWQQHVSTWRTSGMTQAAYCRQYQLNATTFNSWVVMDRKASLTTTSAPRTIVPVVIQPNSRAASFGPATTRPRQPSLVLQRGNGWQLHLPADIQVAWLAQLLTTLA